MVHDAEIKPINFQFSRTHCECDEKFRKCLQSLNTGKLLKSNNVKNIHNLKNLISLEPANTIGAAFFNVVQVVCFETRPTCSKLQR